MTSAGSRHGLGDPRIPWVVLLEFPAAPGMPRAAELQQRLREVAVEAGWPAGAVGSVLSGERRELLDRLAADGSVLLAAGTHPGGLVVAARHDALDGLALLAAGSRVLGRSITSAARGVGTDRPAVAGPAAIAQRLWELAVRPQARVAAVARRSRPGDSFAAVTVDGAPGTVDLVHAGARATTAWNHEHGRPARRITVAVGVSLDGGTATVLADRSGYLRLSGVELLDLAGIGDALRTAPLQPGGGGQYATGPVARLASIGTRLAAPRLGSTLLVSHLGRLDAADAPPSFFPVTGGGSGLSVGAATAGGRTTITARARRARYTDEELEHWLELLVAEWD